ncbi:hypothetical protein KC357_g8931 [Hortaea werneckii]|nr:hypothetical protein KC357_g8931 [Hortaea werneckii]
MDYSNFDFELLAIIGHTATMNDNICDVKVQWAPTITANSTMWKLLSGYIDDRMLVDFVKDIERLEPGVWRISWNDSWVPVSGINAEETLAEHMAHWRNDLSRALAEPEQRCRVLTGSDGMTIAKFAAQEFKTVIWCEEFVATNDPAVQCYRRELVDASKPRR